MTPDGLHRTIRQQIADQIRAEVLSGQWPEGTQLREQDLAQRFGVSRGPIRDSLLQLTHEGLLVSKPNCGVTVGSALHQELQPLVIELRLKIEMFALGLLMHDSEKVLPRLQQTCHKLKEACQSGNMADVVQYDMAFHRFIVQAGGQNDLVGIWLPIVMRMMLHYTRHKDLMDSYQEHLSIVHAIQTGDETSAREALAKNIQ